MVCAEIEVSRGEKNVSCGVSHEVPKTYVRR
jgi:hypothetical protein